MLALTAAGCGSSGSQGADLAGSDALADDVADASGPDVADAAVHDTTNDSAIDADDDLIPSDVTSDHGDAWVPFYPDTLVMDDVIRLNQIQIKGTHNSYHIESPESLPQWRYTMAPLDVQLESQAVRQVELDIHLTYDNDLEVFHVPFADPLSTCVKFKDCLRIVRNWSDRNPSHLPIFILIEPKDDMDGEDLKLVGRLDLVEQEILTVFKRERIITPDEVRNGHSSLREALVQDGWPTLGQSRGRVMFLMLDNAEHLDAYLLQHPNLEGALIFGRNGRGEPWSSILELMHPDRESRFQEIQSAVDENYLVRSNADDSDTPAAEAEVKAAKAIESGAHLINTDHPVMGSVSNQDPDYKFDLPDGVTAICNAKNAPEGCTPEILERLKPDYGASN
ncbi:MAG TPA: Ca2+-dependent phosphoinositide-specific phospholipase C [Myxococcota bacterium]|nr:Ca2+-dependent phosphoinositide-specific phospholipase C [Myxococcota bacterium]HPV04136.1 Ca2+-dependent phosphoinositide-specific phospholipase C [Myxococcota bacterium]